MSIAPATDLPSGGTEADPADRSPAPTLASLVGVVAQRELLVKLRDKTFIFSTIFLLVMVALSIAVPTLLDQGNPTLKVGTVGPAAAAVAGDAARLGNAAAVDDSAAAGLDAARVESRTFPDVAAAEAAVRAGSIDAAIVPASGTGSGAGTAGAGLELVGGSKVPAELTPLVTAAARTRALTGALQGAGLSPADATRALATASSSAPAERLLDPPAHDRNVAFGLSAAFAFVFFLASFLFGLSIAQSVVEEKQSRVVEILVAAVPVRALLAGKVAANTVLALGQTVLLAGVGMAAAGLAGQGDVIGLILRTAGWFLLFFVLGFTMLATLWAAAGAIASRLEDLNATTVPLQMLVYIPFFAALWVREPGPLMRVLSYVPFTAPLSMPQRLALGDAAWWEALLSAAIVLATAAALVGVAARLYERNVLRTAGRTPWREAWNA